MPGTVLVETDLPVVGGRLKWDLDAYAMNRLAANFDVRRGLADMITVTFTAQEMVEGDSAQWVGQITAYGAKVVPQPLL